MKLYRLLTEGYISDTLANVSSKMGSDQLQAYRLFLKYYYRLFDRQGTAFVNIKTDDGQTNFSDEARDTNHIAGEMIKHLYKYSTERDEKGFNQAIKKYLQWIEKAGSQYKTESVMMEGDGDCENDPDAARVAKWILGVNEAGGDDMMMRIRKAIKTGMLSLAGLTLVLNNVQGEDLKSEIMSVVNQEATAYLKGNPVPGKKDRNYMAPPDEDAADDEQDEYDAYIWKKYHNDRKLNKIKKADAKRWKKNKARANKENRKYRKQIARERASNLRRFSNGESMSDIRRGCGAGKNINNPNQSQQMHTGGSKR